MSNHLFFLGKALEGLTTGFAVGLQERQKIQAEVEQQKLKTRQTEVTEAAKTAREETKEAGRLATEEQKTLREESRRQQLQEKFEKQFGVQLEQVRQSGLRAEAAAEAAKLKAQQTQGELSEQFAIGAKRNLSAISLRNDREGLIQYLNFFQKPTFLQDTDRQDILVNLLTTARKVGLSKSEVAEFIERQGLFPQPPAPVVTPPQPLAIPQQSALPGAPQGSSLGGLAPTEGAPTPALPFRGTPQQREPLKQQRPFGK